jgi:hypothetical protein
MLTPMRKSCSERNRHHSSSRSVAFVCSAFSIRTPAGACFSWISHLAEKFQPEQRQLAALPGERDDGPRLGLDVLADERL